MYQPLVEEPTEHSVKSWKEKGYYRQIHGHKIFVIDELPENTTEDTEQTLETIILIHGFPTSSWDWKSIWSGLNRRYRLLTLDMLGFGFSDKPNQRSYTIHKQADLFSTVIRELDLSNYHILAHDYGDTVAQELLARHAEGEMPKGCLSACFLNGGLFPETHRALLTQKLLLSPLGKLVNCFNGFSSFSKNFSSLFGKNTKPSEFELEGFWQIINENNGKHLFYNLITYIEDRKKFRERWLKPLQKSPLPLALINGSVDPVSGKHMVARYKELNCRLDYLKELDDIGHYPQVEDPESVLSAYSEFLNGI